MWLPYWLKKKIVKQQDIDLSTYATIQYVDSHIVDLNTKITHIRNDYATKKYVDDEIAKIDVNIDTTNLAKLNENNYFEQGIEVSKTLYIDNQTSNTIAAYKTNKQLYLATELAHKGYVDSMLRNYYDKQQVEEKIEDAINNIPSQSSGYKKYVVSKTGYFTKKSSPWETIKVNCGELPNTIDKEKIVSICCTRIDSNNSMGQFDIVSSCGVLPIGQYDRNIYLWFNFDDPSNLGIDINAKITILYE